MEGDLVRAGWAKWARQILEKAIADLNADWPQEASHAARVIWGQADNSSVDIDRRMRTAYRSQEGLMTWLEHDFEVEVWKSQDRYAPDRCHLYRRFDEPLVLPRSARDLYNVMQSCQAGVSLDVLPDFEAEDIFVMGVTTVLAVEAITARILCNALNHLEVSHGLIHKCLTGGGSDDHWSADGGYEPRPPG